MLLYTLGLASFVFVSCGVFSGKEEQNAGIEIGNPSLTVSTEFALADGEPSILPLAKKLSEAVSVSQFTWSNLRLPLTKVSYYASYYYYNPTDPSDGTELWPATGLDTLLPIDILDGDTLVSNLDSMDIPSRSYLKEVGLRFNLSNWTMAARYCFTPDSCRNLELVFPDSLYLDVRYHHDQLKSESDTSEARLSVRLHTAPFLQSLDFTTRTPFETSDSILHYPLTANDLLNLGLGFNGIRFSIRQGSTEPIFTMLPAAILAYDIPKVDRVQNNSFSERGKDWIFLTQLGGIADTSFGENTAQINIQKGGSRDYSVQWMQEDIELIAGRHYLLHFKAWSNLDASKILVRIGRYMAPYDNLDIGNQNFLPALTTAMQTFEYNFIAKETTLFGRLEFNLGLTTQSVSISDVSIVQLAE